MSVAGGVNIGGSTFAVGLLVACAGAAAFGLSWVATPTRFQTRLDAVEERLESAETSLRKDPGEQTYPAKAVCSDAGDGAPEALGARLQAAAAGSGLTLTSIATTAAPREVNESALTPISLRFEVSGRYDAVLAMLGTLARQTPTIFTDSADLTSQISSVDLKFTGRVYCALRT